MVVAGLSPEIAGAGALIVNGTLFEAPPSGVITETLTVPAAATKFAATAAVRLVEFTTVVGSAKPSHLTAVPGTKFDPYSVRVKAVPPAVAEDGLRIETAGTGE